MAADYGRALAGMTLTLGPLTAFGAAPAVAYVLGGLGALFGAFGVYTALRHATRVELTDDAIRVHGPTARELRWCELEEMTLAYRAPRRDRASGWMQLKLKGRRRGVTLDSTIEGFTTIARSAAAAAAANRLELSEPTRDNLAALAIGPAARRNRP